MQWRTRAEHTRETHGIDKGHTTKICIMYVSLPNPTVSLRRMLCCRVARSNVVQNKRFPFHERRKPRRESRRDGAGWGKSEGGSNGKDWARRVGKKGRTSGRADITQNTRARKRRAGIDQTKLNGRKEVAMGKEGDKDAAGEWGKKDFT